MDKRLLMVFALSFLVLLLVQAWVAKNYKKPAEPQKPATQAAQTSPAQPPATAETPATAPVAMGVTKQGKGEETTVVENDLFRITFTNRGGQVKSWILKKYNDDKGHPLELVNTLASEKYGYPLSLYTYDEPLRNKLNSVLYVPSETGSMKTPGEIAFEYADGDVTVRKSFRFENSYEVHVEASVISRGSQVTAFTMWPAGFGDQTVPASYAASRVDWQQADKIERVAIKKVSNGNTIQGPFEWAGVVDQYFAAVFLPEHPDTAAMVTLHNNIDIPKNLDKPDPKDTTKVDVLGAGVGNLKRPTSQMLFVGPKDVDILQAVRLPGVQGGNADLSKLVDFGKYLGWIAKPLFVWLKWTYHKFLPHNWGWAIIWQTIIINLALLPLRLSSMKSSLKMQKLAPQMKAIQDKYKKYGMRDPRKAQMQQEIGELYKREGVNPIGGCLPLVVQMPFLIAYYSMLGVAIELRQAPWGWMHDLSSSDPYHILPIGIIITTLLVQKMTPQAGVDPTQQKMMTLMMPLMLGFISWNLAAGLCLYWVVGNLIAIIQQAVMNRTSLGQEMRAEMEKRARKKAKV
jgi:YidC/Oxa1 family membrane protein insertase